MLNERVSAVLEVFATNVQSVRDLMVFDRSIVGFAIERLRIAEGTLKALDRHTNAEQTVSNAIRSLENIQRNDSLRRHYAQMLNQCDVLLVSYFSAAVGDVFRAAVVEGVRTGSNVELLKADVRLTLGEVHEAASDISERMGELFVEHQKISFQDMQSIARAFNDHLGIDVPRDETLNDIILSQACRHVLVHSGGRVDRKLIAQVRKARPRTVKLEISEGEQVQFSETEIGIVATQMSRYLESLTGTLMR